MARSLHRWLQHQQARLALRRGLAYLRKDNFPKAIAALTDAIAHHPNPARVLRQRAQGHWQWGDTSAARADYDQALTLNPQDCLAYGSRGLLRYGQGDEAGALADWHQALHIDPQNATVYYNRGLLYAQTQRWERALADLDQAIARQPLLAAAYLHRGKVRYQLGDAPGAVEDWEMALCNDLRLDEASQWLQTLNQEAQRQTLIQQLVVALPPEFAIEADINGDTLRLSLHRPLGTPVNYFALRDTLRDRLVELELPEVRRFQLTGKAGEATLAEWNQTYAIYDRLPCPPTHWRAALASTLLLFPPFGVVALTYAAQVRQAYRRGDYPIAARASKTVKGLCLGSGAIAGLLLCGLMGYGVYTQVEITPPSPSAKTALLPSERDLTP
jgi:tetratricopeptide (TPR) repeat protein